MTRFDRLDVIIPTLNAGGTLSRTLASLPSGVAVTISDGGSSDATIAIAGAAGCRIIQGDPGRGRQLAAGARAAERPWRLFLHADTLVRSDGWEAIIEHMARPEAKSSAASLRLVIDDTAWQARVIERGVALRVRWLVLPYGDQGLLIHRDLYQAVGGYCDLPLMEDVEIMGRLGRARHVALKGCARTSAVRWRRRGWLGQTVLNLSCLILYRFGVSADRIAGLYGR
ncbi:TIGR04283 family arsenosugar biosynthesis glycosyltransferase [Brevundimonas sp.]